jgi:hypothetical protein
MTPDLRERTSWTPIFGLLNQSVSQHSFSVSPEIEESEQPSKRSRGRSCSIVRTATYLVTRDIVEYNELGSVSWLEIFLNNYTQKKIDEG